ncbi:phenylalanyl-tRNA synthetase alpha chain [Pancytospora philotis]|nr:phenylalanyl-tRNA synthetase alpha chain [Pancytospora philotis]
MAGAAEEILRRLETEETVHSSTIDVPAAELHGILLSLHSKELVDYTIEEVQTRSLTEEGREIAKSGSPEYRLFQSIPADGAERAIMDSYGHGSKHGFKRRWIELRGERVFRLVDSVEDVVAAQLRSLDGLSEKDLAELKRRGLVKTGRANGYVIRRGSAFGTSSACVSELTAAMVSSFDSALTFKRYNFDAPGNYPQCGALHPIMKIREEFKKIFIEMGFSEMNTSKYVESSFWNFDSLFQPQNHPARDSHDTFFLKSPATTNYADMAEEGAGAAGDRLNSGLERDYIERVRTVHSSGGHGSTGHSANWSLDEASKNILRTHTTSVSARYLKAMAKDFKPTKLFSIDKVFRNESVDATHLAEFHQVEGLIVGYDLGIAELMGVLSAFFAKLGLEKIKFKPAFNPYTEPSMEVFGFHEGLGRWIEIGNSGIFRPEMLGPMGYPEDVCVIAWGLSLERPAMIKYGLNNIRELVGHKVDLNFIKNSEFIYFK